MIKFIKENLGLIVKLILNQIGAAVLGLTITVAASSNDTLLVFVSCFATIFYLSLLYSAMWEEGGKERIRVDGGRAAFKPLRGLYIALVANIPNFILAVLIILGNIFGSLSGPFAWEWAGNIGFMAGTIARLYEAMYLGLVQAYSPNNPIAFLLIIIPAVAVSGAAYAIGLHNKRIFSFLTKKK